MGFSPFQVVYSIVPRGPVDLIPLPNRTRFHGKAKEFVGGLQEIHKQLLSTSQVRIRDVAMGSRVGDFVWAVLIKDRFSVGDYNKLSAKKIDPVEILEKIIS